MANAAIKLESFAPARQSQPVATFSREELDRAYADGLAEGCAQRDSEESGRLMAALELLSQALSDDEARRDNLRKAAVAALFPLVSEIVDAFAPATASERLERALSDELERLAQTAPPVRARIACSEKLRGLVESCISKSGMDQIEVELVESDRVSVSLTGGSIEFSQEKIARQVRELIDEIKEDIAAWPT